MRRALRVLPGDWLALFALVVMWGSAFALTTFALETLDPWWVTASRLTLGALVLLGVALARGVRVPRDARAWGWFAWLGLVGNVAPFALIAWGQQHVASSLAGILMAVVPLLTIVLAHALLPDEPLNRRRVAAFLIGFAGVVLLIGPLAVAGLRVSGLRLVAELAILGAACGYALNGVTARLAPALPGLTLATGVLCAAALQALLLAALIAPAPTLPGWRAGFAVFLLGVFPTALGAAILYPLLARAGAAFVALTNYLVPVFSLLLGVALLGESLAATDYAGLALILGGVAISRWRGAR